MWFSPLIIKARSEIISDPQVRLIRTEPQYRLADYSPIMMSKIYMVEEAKRKHDRWNTDYF